MNPFEYASDLITKEHYDSDISERKDYKKFLINRTLSYHIDLLHYINEMNLYTDVDDKLHYDFLYHSIDKKKRARKFWIKGKKIENIELIKSYFNYSNSKAEAALSLLSESDIEHIKKMMYKGGSS